jgi:hypothetical protein
MLKFLRSISGSSDLSEAVFTREARLGLVEIESDADYFKRLDEQNKNRIKCLSLEQNGNE